MLRWYKYLFYRIYEWRISRPKTAIGQPEIDATLFIAMANLLYLMGILVIISAFFRVVSHALIGNIGEAKIVAGFSAVMFALAHLYIYVWSGNSKKIIKEFGKSKTINRYGTIAVIIYLVFSYIFFIASGLLIWPSIHANLPQF